MAIQETRRPETEQAPIRIRLSDPFDEKKQYPFDASKMWEHVKDNFNAGQNHDLFRSVPLRIEGVGNGIMSVDMGSADNPIFKTEITLLDLPPHLVDRIANGQLRIEHNLGNEETHLDVPETPDGIDYDHGKKTDVTFRYPLDPKYHKASDIYPNIELMKKLKFKIIKETASSS